MRKRWQNIVLFIGLLSIVLITSFSYFKFISSIIYEESVNHLTEIYTHANYTVRDIVNKNWMNLQDWAPYIEATKDENQIVSYIQARQKCWEFTDFYFISHDGNYCTLDGKTGYLNFQNQLERLILQRECVAVDATLPGSSGLTICAIPTTSGKFKNFSYEAIAIGFNNSDIVSRLQISTFDGQSVSYVIYSDGRVLIDGSTHLKDKIHNILSWLENNSDMTTEQIDELYQKFQNKDTGVIIFKIQNEKYYLVYEPVDFQDWIVLGIVPTRVVNGSMSRLQNTTLVVTITLCGMVVLFLFYLARKRLKFKDTELIYREELFSTLTDNVNDIFIMLDTKDYKVSYISPNIEKILGISAQEIRTDINSIERLNPKKDTINILERLNSIIINCKTEWEQEYIHCSTGETCWFHVTAYHTEIQKVERYVLVLSDRTQELQLNQTLRNALQVTKSANEAKRNFLANISHDIRTPMNAIIGFTTLLDKEYTNPDKVQEYTKKLMASSKHLLGLINDVLDMSKIESGKTSLNITEISLSELLEEIYTIVLPQTKAKKQTFDIHTKGNLSEKFLGDKSRLNQILLNLLSNAVKYTQIGGQISLIVEQLDQNVRNIAHLRFIVKDNGYGMSEEFKNTIFDAFVRENNDRNQKIQGTGLGMAITKNIVDLMGGTISVDSTLTQGSTFTVNLEFKVIKEKQNNDFWRSHNIARMLVTDDEEDICIDIQKMMLNTGVKVSYATNGNRAIEMVVSACNNHQDYNIIVIDWKMPNMDGIETVKRIRKKVGNSIPIFILSAYDFSEIEEEAKQAGFNLFLQKPFFVSNFQRVVEEFYENSTIGTNSESIEKNLLTGLHVLIAEDNEINSEILSELLKIEGITCEIAQNGLEAFECFLNSKPQHFDMIFMDIQMPIMNGYEATKKIRSCNHINAKSIPIIAMTANAFDKDVQKALEVGMNVHISKPIDMTKLKSIIIQQKKDFFSSNVE